MSIRANYSNMLQEYNVGRIRQMNLARAAKIDSLQSQTDAESYCLEVRSKISACFKLPERSGLPEVEITGIYEFPECRVEKTIFWSRPGYPVTSLLYLPSRLPELAPAVLFLCGHAQDGKSNSTYMTCCRSLAKAGYVVLAIDPAGQGERYQFKGVANASGIDGFCTREHNMIGKQLNLCGDYFGTWRAHDALSGLDYLLSRPEVDINRVGVTGNSGGGTMTTFVQALDYRFTMAAPSCYVTSWKRNIENELPADVEQIPPGILEAGCEMGDFILAFAPRPVILLGQKKDFFDPRGLRETYEQCRKVYALLGAAENIRMAIGPDPHGYSETNRKNMYSFFGEIAEMPMNIEEPETYQGAPENLWCAPGGQVINLPQSKLIHDFVVEKLDALAASRPRLDGEELRRTLAARLGVGGSVTAPYYRVLRHALYNHDTPAKVCFSRFALETEPGILTILKLRQYTGDYGFPDLDEITLYAPHLDSVTELLPVAWEGNVAGVDVRGIGESMAQTCDWGESDFFAPYGRDYHYNSCAVMFGSSMLADRVRDLLGAVAFCKSRGVGEVKLAGRGMGAIIAALAALISEDVNALTLFDAPESWDMMARSRITLWPQSMMPQGILQLTDLPEIYQAVQDKMPLHIVNYMDELMRQKY